MTDRPSNLPADLYSRVGEELNDGRPVAPVEPDETWPDSRPLILPVTDTDLDAPDGAKVDGYRRSGDQWVRLPSPAGERAREPSDEELTEIERLERLSPSPWRPAPTVRSGCDAHTAYGPNEERKPSGESLGRLLFERCVEVCPGPEWEDLSESRRADYRLRALSMHSQGFRAGRASGEESELDRLRADGWAVAVHNDYRLNGAPHTFWLFTKGDHAAKGEGQTDAEALVQVREAVNRIASAERELEALKAELAKKHHPDTPIGQALAIASLTRRTAAAESRAEQATRELEALRRELKEANHWRERHSRDASAAAAQSQCNWASAEQVTRERDEAVKRIAELESDSVIAGRIAVMELIQKQTKS